ncbi:hypothetical protein QL989_03725 [Pseudoalteromonas sp. APC 3224]|uniref:hypothetical protein n=1 Tax=Pseudoalteromonas sp. APC 3224 TaxID=3035203 RepID=UPI0025B389C6|nr:hypothetical protein [Pseudoalteromonas sp. APC 3224]MDN3484451.1 hypothetical protein [Pseudoalteromonas sp. APC 3224]
MSNLICSIELDKVSAQGITIEVKDKEGNNRTVQLNDKGITLTCTDGNNFSEIKQDPKSIELLVNEGPSSIKMEKDKISIHCKDLEINAENHIQLTSKQDTKMKAQQGITLESTQDTKIIANQAVNIKAASNVDIEATANFSAKANAKADLQGNLTTVKGSLTTIQGELVKLG